MQKINKFKSTTGLESMTPCPILDYYQVSYCIQFSQWIKYKHTLFPQIVAAATILFWCGKYSREETIVFLLFGSTYLLFLKMKEKSIDYFIQFRSSKLIFVVKRLLKLGNLAQKVPHLAIWLFYNNICNNFSSEETIEGRKLLKGGNY